MNDYSWRCRRCGRRVDEGERGHMIAVIPTGYIKVCADCARED
jgi:NAD-dependent SIR2 family protein deacetylase